MRAVVMAGGEGSRLRPLTSNQPKPMVSLCGKPCMEYILELLSAHDIRDVVATLMFMPKVIRDYFSDGSSLRMNIDYSVEIEPAGTAGSVKLAADLLAGETFVVISGDALTDFDLTDLIAFHRRRGAMATIALKRVENPLEFGIVVTGEDGRIERFLEKPTWGQVFSDTANTGIYVLEPEVLEHIPSGTSYDFSRDLFPRLFEMGAPLYGYVGEGYWQDIGSLPQYLAANRDILDGTVRAAVPGLELRNRVFLGDGVNLDSLEEMTGPVFVGNYARLDASARIGPYSVLGSNVVVKGNAEVRHSVIGANTYIDASAAVHGSIIGRHCDIKAGARCSEGVAIGDDCTIGEQAYLAPDVKVYPFKSVDAGAQVHSSIIWESRGSSRLFGKQGVSGVVNVDITAELALNLAMAYGTTLPKGAGVTTSRDANPASRLIKRALIAGLNSTGVLVRDLRHASSAVNRFEVKHGEARGGMHVRTAGWDPESVQIQVFEPPGVDLSERRQKDVERTYGRQDFRRAFAGDIGRIEFPDRAIETYARSLIGSLDTAAIRRRGYRLAIDYSFSPAALILPHILGELGAEVLAVRPFSHHAHDNQAPASERDVELLGRLVRTMEADMGLVIDSAAERIIVVDERGREIPFERMLLLFVRLIAGRAKPGEKIVLPLTITSRAEQVASGSPVEVLRTQVSLPALASASLGDGVVFAGTLGGGYIFPRFLPAFDAVMSLGMLLELLAPTPGAISTQAARLPETALVHRTVACPWSLKGMVMRTATEQLQREAQEGRGEVSLVDGVRIAYDHEWIQLLPDADEPIFHVYAEGTNREDSERLADGLAASVRDVINDQNP